MEFVETHVHLDDDAFATDLPQVLEAAREVGVHRFINIGYEPESWTRSIDLANAIPGCFVCAWNAPQFGRSLDAGTARELERLLSTSFPVAIGEIGLDFFRDRVDPGLNDQHSAINSTSRVSFRCQSSFICVAMWKLRSSAMLDAYRDVRAIFHSFDASDRIARFR